MAGLGKTRKDGISNGVIPVRNDRFNNNRGCNYSRGISNGVEIKRRKTRQVRIGNVKIGGNSQISIQSMAKTDIKDASKILREIGRLQNAGCEIVRVAVKDEESAACLADLKKRVNLSLVADIHFNYKTALMAIEKGADAVRLNPGNIKKIGHIKEILKSAKKRGIPVRIGVNSGSLKTADLMVKGVLGYLKIFEEENFRDIIISLKSHSVSETIEANRRIAGLCNYPIHLGVTASGPPKTGVIKSAIGIGTLLSSGIGDTVRVSLTADSCEEVAAAKSILQSLRLRRFGPEIISCPTCGRCRVDLIGIVNELENKLFTNDYRLTTNRPLTIAVMGCEVNGPGEAKEAEIGIAAGKKSGVLFKKGKIVKRIKESDFVKEIVNEIKLIT